MKKLWMVVSLVVMMVLAACGSSEEEADASAEGGEKETVTIKHELGTTEVEKNPENVVVFDFGALDTLDTLGVEVAGVAKSSTLPDYLSKYEEDSYENIGSLKEPDFEKINSMEPGLIIISGRQSGAYEDLSDIAPTVYAGVDNENYMESFEKNTRALAKIFDKTEEADEKITEVKDSIAQVKEDMPEDKAGLVTLTTGGKVSAYGPGSRFGLIHDVFGVPAADQEIEASTHGMSVTFEYIAETNPDYLFIIDRDKVVSGESQAKKLYDNELVDQTEAKQVYLDPAVWYLSGGGLRSTEKMAEEISAGMSK
ncbi:siderophore ABC transporter substrate-binding protein [Salimicrobium flavidum]|uniref:Iron complex transport system substrate-binding protein n=1 Tax=Salimicrobium flavidum TaxID=570947 RepID=A0A1N7JY71_9BACI|nr:siderophore ABC transporter substrate-binding protein [Salimicrobium flavidum]SIS54231.1 iron complex transport system substrate-binding protein [Salimicrobium flavidum]